MRIALVLRQLIIGFSGVAAGVALWGAWYRTRAVFRGRKKDAWPLLTNLGVAGLVLLIGEAVLKAPFIPSSWRAWTYLLCLILASLGIGGSIISRHREELSHES